MKTLARIFTITLPAKQQNQTISDRGRVLLEITNQHSLFFFFTISLSLCPHILTCTQTRLTPPIEVSSEKIN